MRPESRRSSLSRSEGTYGDHDLERLLQWSIDGTRVIDARLRFDTVDCAFAAADDREITLRLKLYFSSEGLFVKLPCGAQSLTQGENSPYDLTALRSRQGSNYVLQVGGEEPFPDLGASCLARGRTIQAKVR